MRILPSIRRRGHSPAHQRQWSTGIAPAFRTKPAHPPASLRVKVPTLMIWGKQDAFIDAKYAQQSIDLCDDGRLEYVDSATHWVHHEEPDRVNALLKEFLV